MIDPNFTIKEIKMTPEYGEFAIEPLEPGYGYTMGHALRRILLTSIEGAAITSVRINGVKHKFAQLVGLKENVVDFLLNLKELHLKLSGAEQTATVTLSVKGTKKITGADIKESNGVEVINKDHYLGYLSGDKAKLDIEMTVEKGFGYSLAEERAITTLGVIPTDAIFTPVARVNYSVEATRVGRRTNLDKLILQIWTNGVVSPREALDEAGKILSSYFLQIYQPTGVIAADVSVKSTSVSEDIQKITVDELDLPTRIFNSLKNGGIETLGHLLTTPRKDLVSMRNMGAKSIAIIEEKLREKGISLSI